MNGFQIALLIALLLAILAAFVPKYYLTAIAMIVTLVALLFQDKLK